MSNLKTLFQSLNRGEVSPLALARTDIEKLRLSAEIQVNYQPRVIGPMMLRPGFEYIGEIYNDQKCLPIPFVAAFADTAIIELTHVLMRVWVNDQLVTRRAVSTIVPPLYPVGRWVAVGTGTSVINLAGNLTIADVNSGATATVTTAVSVLSADQATEHAVRIVVDQGPILFRVGSQSGLDDIFETELLAQGTYSMAFTPNAGTIYLQFSSTALVPTSTTLDALPVVIVRSIAIEPPGVMQIPAPWNIADLPNVRYDQSADVIYLACKGYPQYKINRYSPTSWSIVLYRPFKGPFRTVGDSSVLIAPGAYSGNTQLHANKSIFKTTDIGTLFRLTQNGQQIAEYLSFVDTYTDAIRVTGVSYTSTVDGAGNITNTPTNDRTFVVAISGSWTGTITLQRSFVGETTGFVDYKTFTANTAGTSIVDGLNNEIIWYRLGFNPGNYTSGTALATLNYQGGAGSGVALVTSYVSPQQVNIAVIIPFTSLQNAAAWYQSMWTAVAGWPTSVVIHEGRLWWLGADYEWGSISDDYENYDIDAIGDSAPVIRSVGQGPIANINWGLSMNHLLAGADTSIIAARSDSIDSPLTPTNFNLKQTTGNGAFPLQAYRIDEHAVYVDQSGRRVYELSFSIQIYNYIPSDMTRLNPDIGIPGFVSVAVQRQPDTRIHFVRTDGQVACLIYDPEDDVVAWWRIQTAGVIENVIKLPGALEDQIYYVVVRTINGSPKRYLEKAARIDECQGGLITKCIDSHLVYQGAMTSIVQAPHLAGQHVVIWGDGIDMGTAIVAANGNIALPVPAQNVVYGLPYTAQFRSTKLAYGALPGSTAINQVKRVDHIGFVLSNTHCQGIQFGAIKSPVTTAEGGFSSGFSPGFQTNQFLDPSVPLDSLPLVEEGAIVQANTIWAQFDNRMIEFPGEHDTDSRIYLQSASPRPCTVVGITIGMNTAD